MYKSWGGVLLSGWGCFGGCSVGLLSKEKRNYLGDYPRKKDYIDMYSLRKIHLVDQQNDRRHRAALELSC